MNNYYGRILHAFAFIVIVFCCDVIQAEYPNAIAIYNKAKKSIDVNKEGHGSVGSKIRISLDQLAKLSNVNFDPMWMRINKDAFIINNEEKRVIIIGKYLDEGYLKSLSIDLDINTSETTISLYDKGYSDGFAEYENDRIIFRTNIRNPEEPLEWNLTKGESRQLAGMFTMDYNFRSGDWVCLYGYGPWFFPVHGKGAFSGRKRSRRNEGLSCFVRYNGYWVYPEQIEGWLTNDQHYEDGWYKTESRNRDNLLRGCHIYGFGVKYEKKIYDITEPKFVNDTDNIIFIEQIYHSDGGWVVAESNIVLLNASKVQNNPPKKDNVVYMKIPIEPLDQKYELSRDIGCKYDKQANKVVIYEWDSIKRERINILDSVELSGDIKSKIHGK